MSDIRKELKQSFDLATLRHVANKRLSSDDWNQFRNIRESHAQARKDVSQRFRTDAPELIAKAKKRILAEEGKVELNFQPSWAARDKFDKDKLHARAVQRVKGWEQAEHRHIDVLEKKQLQSLVDTAEAKGRLRDQTKRDFTRATDRRKGPDRRR